MLARNSKLFGSGATLAAALRTAGECAGQVDVADIETLITEATGEFDERVLQLSLLLSGVGAERRPGEQALAGLYCLGERVGAGRAAGWRLDLHVAVGVDRRVGHVDTVVTHAPGPLDARLVSGGRLGVSRCVVAVR
jgi:hypothetical protein